jgi:hypothetical protein
LTFAVSITEYTNKALTVTGTTSAGEEIEVPGTYTLGNDVTGTNDGTMTVKSGGKIYNETGVTIGGTGNNVVKKGGAVYFGGATNTPYVGDTDAAIFQLADDDSTFSYNNDGYVLTKAATFNGAADG